MKIIFAGGGTMGHISPSIAVAESLKHKNSSTEILFINRKCEQENKHIRSAGFQVREIEISGLIRKINFRNFKNLYTAVKAISEAKKVIREFSPDVVFATGGYVSFPVLYAAKRLSVPTVIHESNAMPGLVTRLLYKRCDKLLLNYPGSDKFFGKAKNVSVVGNPVKDAFIKTEREAARKKLGIKRDDILIASFGGSGGSEKLNSSIIEILKNHSVNTAGVNHIHSCGKRYYEEIAEKHPEFVKKNRRCRIVDYISNMPEVICASDIVITRCGAVTLSEISAAGASAILIPSPNVTDNHQLKNAKFFSDANAGILIEEDELSERTLLDAIRLLETNVNKRRELSENAKALYNHNCKNLIIQELEVLASKKP
jgi:UDP-N-acetylglucosamine--N-acetylmuramyl-(pentapeptide) pyrophosphoryl-undecaprenol N-acetylglucosamine transferase